MLGALVVWILIGLVAGALARLIVPGPDPIGVVGTILLGLAGSFVGGLLAAVLFGDGDGVGLFGAVAGAVVVLLAWRALTGAGRGPLGGRRRRWGRRRYWGAHRPFFGR